MFLKSVSPVSCLFAPLGCITDSLKGFAVLAAVMISTLMATPLNGDARNLKVESKTLDFKEDKDVRRVWKRETAPETLKQVQVNAIASALHKHKIDSRAKFLEKLDAVMGDSQIDPKMSGQQLILHIQAALEAYSDIIELPLSLKEGDQPRVLAARRGNCVPCQGDFLRVTNSYDRLARARVGVKTMSQNLCSLLADRDEVEVPAIILGAGDNGTTLWLEKHRSAHGTANAKIGAGDVPEVLILGEDLGIWGHDYTLGQSHGNIERANVPSNPCDFLPTEYYTQNPLTNARHLAQANVISLSETEAPLLLGIKVLRIEKKENHAEDWKCPKSQYRLLVSLNGEKKAIYTDLIDSSMGLGPARLTVTNLMDEAEAAQLTRFDPVKGYTPIVDGNQFILTDSEEKGNGRRIVVYGGGGTSTAVYRKGFFGTDIRTEDRQFEPANEKNSVHWYSKHGFDKAGTGRLVTDMYEDAKRRNLFVQSTLTKVTNTDDGLLLECLDRDEIVTHVECDQLVLSIGQVADEFHEIAKELDDLILDEDDEKMPLSVRTPDDHVHFFGPGAAVLDPQYASSTSRWLETNHVSPDMPAGSMPPTRAQMKRHLLKEGQMPTHINANVDHNEVIRAFFLSAGVEEAEIPAILVALHELRGETLGGGSHQSLQQILKAHQIEDKVKISGQTHLILA